MGEKSESIPTSHVYQINKNKWQLVSILNWPNKFTSLLANKFVFFCPVLLVSQQQLYVATTHKPISQRYDALRRYVCQRQHQIAEITGRQTVVASKSSGSNRTPINVTNVREQLWSCCCVLALVVSIYVGTCMAGWLTHVQKWSNISWCSPLIIHTWVSVHRVAILFAAFID